jgi:hypothetical protein
MYISYFSLVSQDFLLSVLRILDTCYYKFRASLWSTPNKMNAFNSLLQFTVCLQNDQDKHWCHILHLKCEKKGFGLLHDDNDN